VKEKEKILWAVFDPTVGRFVNKHGQF